MSYFKKAVKSAIKRDKELALLIRAAVWADAKQFIRFVQNEQ